MKRSIILHFHKFADTSGISYHAREHNQRKFFASSMTVNTYVTCTDCRMTDTQYINTMI